MGIFGWDYPPGCHSVPGDEPWFCEVCWGTDIDPKRATDSKRACICLECHECGKVGDLNCYKPVSEGGHGLVINEAQKHQKAHLEELQRQMEESMEKGLQAERDADEDWKKYCEEHPDI